MRYAFVVALLMPMTCESWAGPGITKGGSYVACISEKYLDKFVSAAGARDYDSMNAMLDRLVCLQMKGGIRVTITDLGFAVTEFMVKGQTFYTVTEAIRRL